MKNNDFLNQDGKSTSPVGVFDEKIKKLGTALCDLYKKHAGDVDCIIGSKVGSYAGIYHAHAETVKAATKTGIVALPCDATEIFEFIWDRLDAFLPDACGGEAISVREFSKAILEHLNDGYADVFFEEEDDLAQDIIADALIDLAIEELEEFDE